MKLAKVFYDFCTELSNRGGFLSEDNIRFYWFASMLKQDTDLNHYSLEEPYPTLYKKELDLMYDDNNDVEKDDVEKDEIWAIEIKFHRHRSTKTFPRPNSAGEMFDDIQRLPLWTKNSKKVRYFFLYVTDVEMQSYLLSTPGKTRKSVYRNQLNHFWSVGVNKPFRVSFDLRKGAPESFFHKACASSTRCLAPSKKQLDFDLICREKRDALKCGSSSLKTYECWVRLYEILQSNNVSAQEIVE